MVSSICTVYGKLGGRSEFFNEYKYAGINVNVNNRFATDRNNNKRIVELKKTMN